MLLSSDPERNCLPAGLIHHFWRGNRRGSIAQQHLEIANRNPVNGAALELENRRIAQEVHIGGDGAEQDRLLGLN